jgi:hypothetical protein
MVSMTFANFRSCFFLLALKALNFRLILFSRLLVFAVLVSVLSSRVGLIGPQCPTIAYKPKTAPSVKNLKIPLSEQIGPRSFVEIRS